MPPVDLAHFGFAPDVAAALPAEARTEDAPEEASVKWRLSDSQVFSSNDANAFTQVPTEWKVAGTGELNGNGRSDILWRSSVTDQLSDWPGQPSGAFVSNDTNALVVVPMSWHIV